MKRFLYEDQDVVLKNGQKANVILYWDEMFYMVVEPEEDIFDDIDIDDETKSLCIEMCGPYDFLENVNESLKTHCMAESWYAFD